jgi:hypothetical protein
LFGRITRPPDILADSQFAALNGDDEHIESVINEAMQLRPVAPMTARLAATSFRYSTSSLVLINMASLGLRAQQSA